MKQVENSIIKVHWTNADALAADIEKKVNAKFQLLIRKLDQLIGIVESDIGGI